MACCNSMLAKRIVLWYILLGSFVIFPLTFNVGLGCRFLNVGIQDQEMTQSFGPFSVAIYDPQADNNFLGCVSYSEFWGEQTSDDIGFTVLRIASAFLLAFTTIATIICVCLQCFSKQGKSFLWNVMRLCYVGALVWQGAMFAAFASNMCKADDEESNLDVTSAPMQCLPGYTAYAGFINFLLLFGMVIATFDSYPPRNPVFQCWGSEMESDEDSDASSTESEDDPVMREFKAMGEARSVSNRDDESVSLFGGSRVSKKSRKSMKSMSGEDDAASAAEKGLSSSASFGSKKSHKSKLSQKTKASQRSKATIPTNFEKYAIAEEGSISNGSKVSAKSGKSAASQKSKKGESGSVVVETVDSASVSTSKSTQSKTKLMPGVAKYLSKSKSKSADNGSVSSSKSNKVSKSGGETPVESMGSIDEGPVDPSGSGSGSLKSSSGSNIEMTSSKLSSCSKMSGTSVASGTTLEVTNFVLQLIEMTQLKEGGERVKIEDHENKVSIVDEYPKDANAENRSNSDSDVVTVRTEYYDLGSRTIKEVKHSDGSTTVYTTIVVDNSSDSTTAQSSVAKGKQPLEPPMELSRSAGSIESANSSKYQVQKSGSSVTSYKGTAYSGKKKQVLKQGDLALSIKSSKS